MAASSSTATVVIQTQIQESASDQGMESRFWSDTDTEPLYSWIDKFYPSPDFADWGFNKVGETWVLPNFQSAFGKFSVTKSSLHRQISSARAVWHDHTYSKAHATTSSMPNSYTRENYPHWGPIEAETNPGKTTQSMMDKCDCCQLIGYRGICPVAKS